MRKDDMVAGRV